MYGWGTVTPQPADWTCLSPVVAFFTGKEYRTAPDGQCREVSAIAPPPAPTGAILTTPPASGDDAQATVDALLNQQLLDQQALNASQVKSTWIDELEGGVYQGGEAAGKLATVAFNWLPWALGAAGVFALLTLTAGSPRRYGR